MSQFNFFLYIKYFVCLKSRNIEGNAGSSASDLKSMDAKYSSG